MPPIVLGKDIAEELGATLNSVGSSTSPQGELTPFGLFQNTAAPRGGDFQFRFFRL